MIHFQGPAAKPADQRRISFVIPGKPVAKQGSNSRLVPSAEGGLHAVHYTPEHVRNWAAYARLVASQHRVIPPWDCAIRVSVVVVVTKPASKKKAVYCTTRPDLDNIEKNLNDAMNKVIYTDDSRIVEKVIRKEYGIVDEVRVTLEKLE
jgi:Holliday junction resolvase RusA-like endonuclease